VASVTPNDSPGLSPERLAEVRALLERAFDGDFSDDDWEHALGGVHVIVTGEDDEVVSHAAVVPRTITIGERDYEAGYVEAVATDPQWQRTGLASTAMGEINDILATMFEVGVLSTGSHDFYARLGWERWRGPTYVRDGDATIRTEDEDDGIMVRRVGPTAGIDLTLPIVCEARPGDPW
jgi:aminoglycoside 2'-N-acetyltransferase I